MGDVGGVGGGAEIGVAAAPFRVATWQAAARLAAEQMGPHAPIGQQRARVRVRVREQEHGQAGARDRAVAEDGEQACA